MKNSWELTLLIMIAIAAMLSICSAVSGVLAVENSTLGIFGNANMDDTIDEKDVAYVEGVISGTNNPTTLCDANYDGKIDSQDVNQIKMILNGTEKELTLVERLASYSSLSSKNKDNIITVKLPINRIIVTYLDTAQILSAIGAEDKIIGVGTQIKDRPLLYPKISKLPSIGEGASPDFESILRLKPDIILPGMGGYYSEKFLDKTPGVQVVYMSMIDYEMYSQNIKKIGYLLNKKDEADEFLRWYKEGIDKITERTKNLKEDDKPKVLLLSHLSPGSAYKVWPPENRYSVMCEVAGGVPIIPESLNGTSAEVDPEWILKKNPDIIFADTINIVQGYTANNSSEMETFSEKIMNNPAFSGLKAAKEGKIYLCAGDVARDSTGGLILAQYMAKCFHPDLFKDIDPKTTQKEYLNRFLGLDYDMDKYGVFIWPPLNEA